MLTTNNANIRDISEYQFTRQDKLFFDTNIWVYLHGRRKILDKNASVSKLGIFWLHGGDVYITKN